MAIELRRQDIERIEQHGVETYRHECCGILLGNSQGARKVITEVVSVKNAQLDSPGNRFLILPEDFLRSEREAEKKGVEILGFYHSHPDQPAQPSGFDREHAWPWFVYLILAVQKGIPQEMAAWTLAEDRSKFLRELIIVSGKESELLTRPGSEP